jgi:hypothetical protein
MIRKFNELKSTQAPYAKNGRSKLQGRCELSGGQRLASSVYLVYCPSARRAKYFRLS